MNLNGAATKLSRNFNRMVMSFGFILQCHRSKCAINTNSNTTQSFGEAHANDVRRLCKQSRSKEALGILNVMDQRGIRPDSTMYAFLLQECVNKKSLPEGKLIHAHMIDTGFNPDIYLETKLVILYAKCGSLVDARRALDVMPKRNAVAWTAVIAACARHGYDEEALMLYCEMRRTGIQPNQFTFASVLPACANLPALEHGKEVHDDVIRSEFQSDVFVGNALVDMYAKCGRMDYAGQVFDEMPERDCVSWNAMIAGYAHNGCVDEARKLFQQMPERNVVAWTALIGGYAQCGVVDEALTLFQKMPERNVVSWNTMISGYVQREDFNEALKLLYQMKLADVKPNTVTFVSVLPACANLATFDCGKAVHVHIIKSGFQFDISVGNGLVDMYSKSGMIDDAVQVFDKMSERNVVSWTAIIAGLTQSKHLHEAMKLFQAMNQRDTVSWNTMIAGYAQNGYVYWALHLFQKLPEQNVVSWNTMIAGYAQNGHFSETLKLFGQMQQASVKPNSVTFASCLPACANLVALQHGKEVHEDIIRRGLQSDIFVGNALIDMYAKCGSIEDAHQVFRKMPERDVVSWNAMILGFAMHGSGKEALQLFEQMKHSSVKPNHLTFVGVLSACCHTGLLDDGWQYFDCMSQDYHITPSVEHYRCMVDLLGRAGCLNEAQDFINKMPIKPDASVWGPLLGACRIHTNIELGECVAERLFESDPKNAAHYVLLSNIYATAGRWKDVERVRKMMKDRSVKRRPGCSWIEVNKKVYTFVIGERSHPQIHQVYAKLERLSGQMKEAGYLPDMNFVLHDVEEEQKENVLYHHSEKLAVAFGLLHTSPGTPIRIIKNLRVCGDCHSALKFISKIVSREIIVRDASRFHHFKDGWCACKDYW